MHDKSKNSGYTATNYTSKIGFQVGGMMNAKINDYFAIRPELLFNSVGAKATPSGATETVGTNYLSLPVNFVGQLPINDKFKLQAFAGPYAALGLGGKYKYTYSGGSINGDVKMKKDPQAIGDKNAYYNPLDFGLNFGIGFQYTGFVFSASYSLGLTNVNPHYTNSTSESHRNDDSKLTNRNLSFGVAYLFGGK